MKKFLKQKVALMLISLIIISQISSSVVIFSAHAQDTLNITEFSIPTNYGYPYGITTGPNGNIWFTESGGGKIGQITTDGTITEFPIPTDNSYPRGITTGPDGNLWFTESSGNNIGRLTLGGIFTEFPIPTSNSGPQGITTGPDGNLWFTEQWGNKIGRISTDGIITEFPIPTTNNNLYSNPHSITTGPDGNLWFTEQYGGKIGRITPNGIITEFSLGPINWGPYGITTGPDGNIWFTQHTGHYIGRITSSGTITQFSIDSQAMDQYDITTGADGNMWFTVYSISESKGKIGKITPSGDIYTYPVANSYSIQGITYGSDGNLWITEYDTNKIGRVNLPSVVTPTPTPAPEPFLDLPWDYEGKGLSFNEAALSINSYFDHEYPLLEFYNADKQCPPAPIETPRLTTTFRGDRLAEPESFYHCHDGYDYGKKAKANLGDPVLAAADGCASYGYSSLGGNVIKIDHGNYYQTRYLHLQDTAELITKEKISCVNVTKGQTIGLVGSTGNSSGAHIHFGVMEDKNQDGNFEDNIPDGVTDPFGWQSKDQDPWPLFVFDYAGQSRTGNRSYYLWKKKLDSLDTTLTSNGGVFNTGRYTVEFPEEATDKDLNLNIQSSPIVEALGDLVSIGTTLDISAYDLLGNLVTSFQEFFDITVDFSSFDLYRYDLETLSIYSSTDGITWTKEPTTIDFLNQTATTQVDHLTHFALLAERIDTIAPITTATISAELGQPNWFREDVAVSLNAEDNEDGLGVDYTLYRIETQENPTDWAEYSSPLIFTTEGHHKIEFYSVDKDENVEEIKTIEFDIDKTIPEARIFIDQDKQDLVVEGIDENQTTIEQQDNTETKKKHDGFYTIKDLAGNTLKLDVRDRDKKKQDRFSIYSMQYNQDTAINQINNHYNVKYKGKKDKLNVDEQNFVIKKEVKIRIKYKQKKNQSIITTKENGEEKIKETRDGLILLQLTTEKGTLKYSY